MYNLANIGETYINYNYKNVLQKKRLKNKIIIYYIYIYL